MRKKGRDTLDTNKLKVLQGIGYRMRRVSTPIYPQTGGGYCGVHEYQHIKHSEGTSFLSVHRLGWCKQWELNVETLATLGLHAFREFAEAEGSK